MYRILYAEDEPVLANIVSDGLKSSGYEVMLATNGSLALELFKKYPPDICVLDVMMPLKDGYTVAEDIRRMDQDTPIIFLSAKSLGEDAVKGFKSGGNDYLKKPFSMDELTIRIEELLYRFNKKDNERQFQTIFTFCGCILDVVSQQLNTTNGAYDISFKEAAMLRMLLLNRNAVLERKKLLLEIWGDDSHYNSRSMDVFMAHIRKMLRDEPGVQLMSIRGIGYKLMC
jgi:DNA-binding response OmpR family regulator